VTLVIVARRIFCQRNTGIGLHTMLDYRTHVENKSLYKNAKHLGIYIINLVCKWLKIKAASEKVAAREWKPKPVCFMTRIDAHRLFIAAMPIRMLVRIMNVTFDFLQKIWKEIPRGATAQNFDGLKGHRSVGGIRASIYHAFPAKASRRSFLQ